MKYFVSLLSLVLCFNVSVLAQGGVVDSLEHLLLRCDDGDTSKVKLFNELSSAVESYDVNKAFEYAILADSLSELLDYQRGKMKSLQQLGRCYYNKHDMLQAASYYQLALELSEQLEDRSAQAYCNNYIGNTYLMQGSYLVAQDYFQKALSLFKQLGDEIGISGCLNNIGNIYYAQGDYPKTLECFHEALKVFEHLDNKTGVSGCLNNIGIIYDQQEDYDEALIYYQRALDIRLELNDQFGMSDCYNNIGNIYVYQEDYTLALEYYQKSLKICEEIDNKYLLSSCYYNIGIIHKSKGDYHKALTYYQKSKEIAEHIASTSMVAINMIEMSRVHYELGHYQQALNLGERGYSLSSEIGERDNIKGASDILAQCYAKVGDYKKAFQYYVVFKTQSDSLQNEANTEKIIGLEYQYKYEKERELSDIEQDKREFVLKTENKRQRTIRNVFVVGFLLMILLASFIVRSLMQKRRANLKLAHQKEEIERQSDELKQAHDKLIELDLFKQGLTSMIIHDLKNPLNGIINITTSLSLERQVLHMKQAGRQMLNMVLDILDVHKYEENKMIVDKAPQLLSAIVHRAIEQVLFLADNKSIVIENTICATLEVNADAVMIERVIVNLLTNAIKYTPNNGHIRLEAEALERPSGWLKVSVVDDGQGIPADRVHLVFAKFAQVDAKNSGRVRSTGLGLTFCKMAVEAHGGSIQVISDLNKGARFEFTLEQGHQAGDGIAQELKQEQVTELALSDDDKQRLLPYVASLKEMPIYKVFAIRRTIREIEADETSSIQLWKDQVLAAAASGNEVKYNMLLDL